VGAQWHSRTRVPCFADRPLSAAMVLKGRGGEFTMRHMCYNYINDEEYEPAYETFTPQTKSSGATSFHA
jgi:hypothetical protein